jgi:hypothetical protein
MSVITGRRSSQAKTQQDLEEDNLESAKLITAESELESIIEPRLNYSDPSTFVTYGSAEKYYTAAVDNITNIYPYDGSKYEKTEWHVSGSGLDNYLFADKYPRTNGTIAISHAGWGATASSDLSAGGDYYLPVDKEYIFIPGGPNTDTTANTLAALFPSDGGKANIIDASENREANLTLGLQNTVEFWMKKDAYEITSPSADGTFECIFDMWTTGSSFGDADYGKMNISLYTSSLSEPHGIFTGFLSASCARGFIFGESEDYVTDGKWHHYAIVSDFEKESVELYIDGEHKESQSLAGPGDEPQAVSGHFNATIGAQYEPVSLKGPTPLAVNTIGWSKLSASLDEFRFWKTARTGEEIGINWNTQVYGGTNTDTANTDLGVYYKFNEGIVGTSQDATVLDFSGRISNGTWTGYSAGARSLESAMVESSASTAEFKDPIIYSNHPDVAALRDSLRVDGLIYDQQNNASLYNSLPSWIREEDAGQENSLMLTQIMSSYLDTLQNQLGDINKIKDVYYPSGSEKPYNLVNRNLHNLGFHTEDFFVDATVLERFMDRNNKEDLEMKISDVKNFIYQNIYNNLTYIMTSKGAEKSFRNLVRCFGVDDELVKLNIYANGEIYDLEDRYAASVIKKRMISFNDPDRFEATMFQTASTADASLGYIESSGEFARMNGMTLEGDIMFPRQKPKTEASYFDISFTKSSLFGMKETNGTDLNWQTPDNADLQVYAVREQQNGSSAYFQLTSSQLGINLTSSVFGDVYDNERWVFGVKVRNPAIETDDDYYLEFQGANANNGLIQNSFTLSASLGNTEALALLDADKRIYAGAYKTNFTGSTVDKSDVLVSAVRYWGKHVSDTDIEAHAIDAKNFGLKDPNRPVFNASNDMPAIDTLKMQWDFSLINSSSAAGKFEILDSSGGSLEKAATYGDFGSIHNGTGWDFPATSNSVVDVEYVNTLTRVNPEVSNGSDMVQVLTRAQEIEQELSKPTSLVFSIEKSLYQTISDEMIRFFSTVRDFGSLYNNPADKYRNKHSELEIMRRNFFDRMENSPDVNKFYEYFKWIDDAVVAMLRQVLPAGAELIDGSINVIEGHILERNKYKHKVPTYVVTPTIDVIGDLQSPSSHVDTDTTGQIDLNGDGAANEEDSNYAGEQNYGKTYNELPEDISSGNAEVDADRLQILNAIVSSPKTVSTLKTSQADTEIYSADVLHGVGQQYQASISEEGLSSQRLSNGKVKIFGKVIITG